MNRKVMLKKTSRKGRSVCSHKTVTLQMVELDRNEKRDKRLVVIFDIKEEDITKLHGHIATR